MKKYLFLALCCIIPLSVVAQATRPVRGIVFGDKNIPMQGATLTAVGSTTSATSSEDGTFEMMVSPYTQFIEASSEGYLPAQAEIDGSYLVFRLVIDKKYYENKAKAEDLEAFFDGAIEPFAIQFSEAMTKMLFSERERAQGSYLIANANRLQYMSTSAKVQMAKELGDRGAILIDEIRELFNYSPLPDGAGQVAPIRGEYKATDELGGNGADNGGNEK